MQVIINVDESMFKDVIENELKAMPQESIQKIIHEAMETYLRDSEVIEKIFVETERGSWNYITQRPSNVLQNAAQNFDLSQNFKEVEELIINELRTNYQKILIKALSNILLNNMFGSYNFTNQCQQVISQYVYEHENRKHN